jgi:hypothetical protein
MVLLLIYMANIYAGYEIARFRARPFRWWRVWLRRCPFWGRPFFFRCPDCAQWRHQWK